MLSGSGQQQREEKVGKDWSEAETPSPTHRQKSLLISSLFSYSLAAAQGDCPLWGLRKEMARRDASWVMTSKCQLIIALDQI